MISEVFMPKLGQTMEEGRIIAWRKAEGQAVRKGEVLLEVETDKADMEIEATADGYLRKILVKEDERVPVFTLVAYIGEPDDPLPTESAAGTSQAAASPSLGTGVQEAVAQPQAKRNPNVVKASPRARSVAKEKGLDLSLVEGSGPAGRIQERDVLAFLEARKGAVGTRTEPLSRLRKAMGQRLQQSIRDAPHFHVTVDVDVTALTQLQERISSAAKEQGSLNITLNTLLLKGVALALVEFPEVNCQLQDQDQVRFNDFVNIGIAVPVEGGLLAPVVVNAHRKSLAEIAEESRELVEHARAGKLTAAPASITVSNLGMFGVREFTAIINPPEAGILAIGTARPTLVVREDGRGFSVAQVISITMSCDHRLIDGVLAARFLAALRGKLESPDAWVDAEFQQA